MRDNALEIGDYSAYLSSNKLELLNQNVSVQVRISDWRFSL